MRAARLKADLSLGLITDDEYHLQMYGRLAPDSAPVLQGTGFDLPAGPSPLAENAQNISPNSDPLGRSVTPDGNKMAKSNGIKAALRVALAAIGGEE